MRKYLCIFLSLLLLIVLFGCTPQERPEPVADDMITFYYRLAEPQYNSQTGVISSELRTIAKDAELVDWLSDYLKGPVSSELQSPFPKSVIVISAEFSGNRADITLGESYSSLNAVNRTIANACLTLTLTQLDGIDAVSIETIGDSFSSQNESVYTAADFAAFDYSTEAVEVSIKLYYADLEYRYLLSTSHLVESGHSDRLPEYVVDCLIDGPADDVMRPVMPEGTRLLDSTVNDGVCTLNFNQAFFDNRPVSQAHERLLIYAIVNSVTSLSGIDSVRFEIEGESAGMYQYMDLSHVYSFCEDVVGPVRTAVNEFDSTVYMLGADDELLAALPLRIRKSASEINVEALARKLLSYTPPTGMRNPIPSDTQLLGVSMEGLVCRVDLSEEFLAGDTEIASRCIISSLSSLSGIYRIQVLVEGEPCTSILQMNESWCYPNP